jgi:transcriptional regulator GlxA family with amidase domain
LIPWISEQYSKGAEVASLCVGAFLLASTGLLNGKKCSTHWGFENEFRTMFPEVEVVEGNVITEENRIYSSGGANSYWNLLLHLVEKFTDRHTAILASKYFAIDIDRESQTAFAMFKGQKNHTDDAVRNAQEFIEKNYHERISIYELAEKVKVGRRSFERRFRYATNNSVLEYIHRIKIEAAKRNFESSRKNISEVMMDVGYSDTKAFRTIFKKITGLTPIEYRNKYNKMV